MAGHLIEEENRVSRHGITELVEHWTIAVSGLVLLISGLFELPMAARYGITAIPGFAWSGDFITSLNVHYSASILFIVVSIFHVIHHGLAGDRGLLPRKGDLKTSVAVIKTFFGKGKEPPFDKYLPEQRLAYAGMACIIAVLILSGLVKTYKNIYAPDLSHAIVLWATWLHNIFFILFILAFVAHIGAILLKPNRPLTRGIFTGAVRLDYARHRHPLWIGRLEITAHPSRAVPADGMPPMPLTAAPVLGAAGLPEGSSSTGEAAERNVGTVAPILTKPVPEVSSTDEAAREMDPPAILTTRGAVFTKDAVMSEAPEADPRSKIDRPISESPGSSDET